MDSNDITSGEIDSGAWDYSVVLRARELGMRFMDHRDQDIANLLHKLGEEEKALRELKTNVSRHPKPLGPTGSPKYGTEKDWADYYATINATYARIHTLKGEIEKVAGIR